jgi:peptidase M48-like protein
MKSVGPKTFPAHVRDTSLPTRPTKSSGRQSEPQDLVELNTGSPSFALKKGLKNAGSFLLQNSLPLIGAAVLGPVGLVVGAAATGAIEYLDRPAQPTRERLGAALRKTLVTSALAGGLGAAGLLWAPLGPLLQTSAAALGSVAAGVLEFGTHLDQKDMRIDLGKFASEYKLRADRLLKEAGHVKALSEVGSGIAVTDKARKHKNQVRLVQTAAIVNHLLGPGVAVTLAGDIGRDRVDASKLSQQVDSFYHEQSIAEHNLEGVQIRRVDGLARRDRSMGMALYNVIFMDSAYDPTAGDAKTDFIVGHELSHVHHRDSSATLAHQALRETVREVGSKTGSPGEKLLLADLENDLSEAILADTRKMEMRADQEGLTYARKHGHSDSEILKSAQEIFGEDDGPDTFQNHPNGAKRTAALRQS